LDLPFEAEFLDIVEFGRDAILRGDLLHGRDARLGGRKSGIERELER
jgi:hypothetical protein